jgi:hypothetical protein
MKVKFKEQKKLFLNNFSNREVSIQKAIQNAFRFLNMVLKFMN